jgi:hypothetical protein
MGLGDILLTVLVIYVFASGLYAIVESYAILFMWPWTFRMGPVLSTWAAETSVTPSLPATGSLQSGAFLIRRTGESEVIFRRRASVVGPRIGYKGRVVWQGGQVVATARWFHGGALVLAGFVVLGLYGITAFASRSDHSGVAGLTLGLIVGALAIWWSIREARRRCGQDIHEVLKVIAPPNNALQLTKPAQAMELRS